MRVGFRGLLLLTFSSFGFGHTIPDEVTVHAYAKAEAGHFRLLVRVPFDALADTVFPVRDNGALDLRQAEPMFPGAARIWIAEWIDLYQGGELLPKPQVVGARIAPITDRSFSSYEAAWAYFAGPVLPETEELFPARAMFDVSLDWPVLNGTSDFFLHSRLARLGGRVVTALQFVPADSQPLMYGFVGDPGVFAMRPRWYENVEHFAPLGLFEMAGGSEYLLLLLCIALRFRSLWQLQSAALALGAGIALALTAATLGFAPEGLWFPILFETTVAASLVYMAFENIWPGSQSLWWAVFAFGLAQGCGLALSLRPILQFGGSHNVVSVMAYAVGAVGGAWAILAILNRVLRLVFLTVPERIATIFLAGIAAHTGWHRMLDRAKWLGTPGAWPQVDLTAFASIRLWIAGALALGAAPILWRHARRNYATSNNSLKP